jgi:hypothetical protein
MRKLFQRNLVERIGNLWPNSFPELEGLLHRYPPETRTDVCNDKLHWGDSEQFLDKVLVY